MTTPPPDHPGGSSSLFRTNSHPDNGDRGSDPGNYSDGKGNAQQTAH